MSVMKIEATVLLTKWAKGVKIMLIQRSNSKELQQCWNGVSLIVCGAGYIVL